MKCRRLIIGTGAYGALPVMEEVKFEARRRKVDLVILPTDRAVDHLTRSRDDRNAILRVTCWRLKSRCLSTAARADPAAMILPL